MVAVKRSSDSPKGKGPSPVHGAEGSGTSPKNLGPIFQVSVADLVIDDALNPRMRTSLDAGVDLPGYEQASLKDLAASLRTTGQLQNIGVDKDQETGKWRVRYGFRRAHAARIGGLESLWAIESSSETAPLAENLGRKNLLPVETTAYVKRLLETQPWATHEELAKQVALSRPSFTNYATLAKKLHPRILEAWRQRPGNFTVQTLLQVAPLSPTQQMTWLQGQVGVGKAVLPVEGTSSVKERVKPKPIPRRVAARLLAVLESGKYDHKGADWCEGASAALRVLLRGEKIE